jgi:hypothetical protein
MTKADKTGVFVFLAALSTACGQNTATAEDKAASAVDAAGSAQDLSGEVGTAELDNAQAVGDAGQPGESLPLAAVRATTAVDPVKSLPLKRGFYVASGTPCGNASNATLMLVPRESINWSRDVCTFSGIQKIGPTSYRLSARCSDGGPSTMTFEVPSDTAFTLNYEGGGDSSVRYCEQSSLPDPWRDNDVSDLMG